MTDEEDRPRAGPGSGKAVFHEAVSHQLGQPLDALSVAEFDARIALLRAEIERLETARAAKAASLAAADAFFKK
ncbi:DUF1192 domain-containing protein [Methylosinus sp. H3A]|uniref:DUF1192 domain-containing protein n=1 Tax=Methylosinus sp. H3A TaxID=2785786 RepID=UPI0018C1E5A8|nr:DUF1192 domain-containing protein [Methylosinus sp. H3A]MBG0810941.1 DUF1192 domain-containing protein [Methylosinus sp. H3A]